MREAVADLRRLTGRPPAYARACARIARAFRNQRLAPRPTRARARGSTPPPCSWPGPPVCARVREAIYFLPTPDKNRGKLGKECSLPYARVAAKAREESERLGYRFPRARAREHRYKPSNSSNFTCQNGQSASKAGWGFTTSFSRDGLLAYSQTSPDKAP